MTSAALLFKVAECLQSRHLLMLALSLSFGWWYGTAHRYAAYQAAAAAVPCDRIEVLLCYILLCIMSGTECCCVGALLCVHTACEWLLLHGCMPVAAQQPLLLRAGPPAACGTVSFSVDCHGSLLLCFDEPVFASADWGLIPAVLHEV